MELRQLEYFMAICEELHFTRASELLGITQPTLSHQIKALENELGVLLFDRIGKKIAITEAGHILKEQGTKIFSNVRSAQERIAELKDITQGKLSIGALPGEINTLVSENLLHFHQLYPQIRMKLIGSDNIMEEVLRNGLDIAVTIMPAEDERIIRIPLYSEQFYLVVPINHELATKDHIDFNEVRGLPLIIFPQNHQCRKLFDSVCHVIGAAISPVIETNTVESIYNWSKMDRGSAYYPKR